MPQDKEKALMYYERGCHQKYVPAAEKLAGIYEENGENEKAAMIREEASQWQED